MIELNTDGLAAAEGWMKHTSATFGLHWKNAKPIIETYLDTIHESDAPALALAILEAAGYTADQKTWSESPEDLFARAMRCLSDGIKEQAKAAAEAKEREELEAEALVLRNAFFAVERKSWDEVESVSSTPVKADWVRTARKARELAKEAGE